ncbi:MAG TPA: hypothetical protein PK250_18545, partial [Syntrophobacter fumaroxidans]|nr:hypothetical protein [Syntrophobacter fumaroxidans]
YLRDSVMRRRPMRRIGTRLSTSMAAMAIPPVHRRIDGVSRAWIVVETEKPDTVTPSGMKPERSLFRVHSS